MSNQSQKLLRRIGPHIHNSWAAASIVRHVFNSILNSGGSIPRGPWESITIPPRDIAALERALVTLLISTEQANSAFEKAAFSKSPLPKCTP